MKFFSAFFLFVLMFAAVANAQSGRKSAPTPAPTPKPDDESQYSESKPRPPRVQPVDRFPGLSGTKPQLSPPVPHTDASKPETSGDEEVLKVETNLVTIPVSVFDRNGLYIPGLRQNDFKIFEDGVEQTIAYFGTQDKPFTVVLLLDTSPSTEYKIDEIHRAAEAFVEQLQTNDRVMVIEFNNSVKIQCEPTADREVIRKAIYRAKFGFNTSLYNAVFETLAKLNRIEGRKAVVLFTDGVDTTSRKHNYEETVDIAEEADSLIFPIYYNTYFDNQNGGGGGWPNIWSGPPAIGTRPEDYALGRKYLDDLAGATGGRVFRPEATPGGLTRAFEGIAEELRRQYNIGYVPADEGKPGQRRTIKVRVNRPNLILGARDSYIVGATKPAPAATPSSTPKSN
jgi:Ca-activated chloride channel homolog